MGSPVIARSVTTATNDMNPKHEGRTVSQKNVLQRYTKANNKPESASLTLDKGVCENGRTLDLKQPKNHQKIV